LLAVAKKQKNGEKREERRERRKNWREILENADEKNEYWVVES
jgi:hypothetical protein